MFDVENLMLDVEILCFALLCSWFPPFAEGKGRAREGCFGLAMSLASASVVAFPSPASGRGVGVRAVSAPAFCVFTVFASEGLRQRKQEQQHQLSLPYRERVTLTSHSAVEEHFFACAKKK
ncbi:MULTISPECIES: hypothetical protein [Stenotrophomonas]|uniref:hypothetical protein n=1 Tax=Stenotrophomonas TaxID=40323 RepID=UPI0012E3D6FC|nr:MULTISPECIES: hypothetical protein [Stenotrophomonas]